MDDALYWHLRRAAAKHPRADLFRVGDRLYRVEKRSYPTGHEGPVWSIEEVRPVTLPEPRETAR